jgi:hypothetical protein
MFSYYNNIKNYENVLGIGKKTKAP